MLSTVYGCRVSDTSPEAAIKNIWLREVIDNEREVEYHKVHTIVSALISAVTMDPSVGTETNRRLLESMYPWTDLSKVKEVEDLEKTRADATKKYEEMLLSGKLGQAKASVEKEAEDKAWVDPLIEEAEEEERKAQADALTRAIRNKK